jgi:hypothetical protein
MLFRETVAVYCENHTEHTNTLCGQNAEFWYVKAGGTYSNRWALKAETSHFFIRAYIGSHTSHRLITQTISFFKRSIIGDIMAHILKEISDVSEQRIASILPIEE